MSVQYGKVGRSAVCGTKRVIVRVHCHWLGDSLEKLNVVGGLSTLSLSLVLH